jgi:peptide/nickel transport system permease protein
MAIGTRRWPGAIIVLLAVHVLAAGADVIAPYPPDEQHRDASYAPPTRIHFADAAGTWHAVPFVYQATDGREDTTHPFSLRFFAAGPAYRLAGLVPVRRRLVGVDAPAHLFLLGTDRFGRDLWSRLVIGARYSLLAGILAAGLALGLGAVIGGVAGYAAGWADDALMWAADLFLSLPWIYLLLAARSALPLDLPPTGALLATAALIGAVGWARPARVARGAVGSWRTSDHVLAARAAGASALRILVVHVAPLAAGVMLTQAALAVPRFVLAEITLSFLGLGVPEPAPSLGTLAAGMLPPGLVASHWWLAAPLAAMVVVFALYDRAALALQRGPASGALPVEVR